MSSIRLCILHRQLQPSLEVVWSFNNLDVVERQLDQSTTQRTLTNLLYLRRVAVRPDEVLLAGGNRLRQLVMMLFWDFGIRSLAARRARWRLDRFTRPWSD